MENSKKATLQRKLRRAATDAESILWYRLRNRQIAVYKFRRQEAIGPYVVDFFCYNALLVVEVDGSQHFEPGNAERDEERSANLRSLGMRVLRFNNREVLTETDAVVDTIFRVLTEPPSP